MALINYDGGRGMGVRYGRRHRLRFRVAGIGSDSSMLFYRRNYYSAVGGSLNFCSFRNNVNPIRFEYNKKTVNPFCNKKGSFCMYVLL